MFPVRGLLAHIACPDHKVHGKQCDRQSCPFDHAAQQAEVRPQQSEDEVAESSASRGSNDAKALPATLAASGASRKRGREEDGTAASSSTTPAVKRGVGQPQYRSPLDRVLGGSAGPRNAYAAAKLGKSVPVTSSNTNAEASSRRDFSTTSGASNFVQASTSTKATAEAPRPLDPILSAPLIPKASHSASSQVPLSIRQSSLRTYFSTFSTLYSPLLPTKDAKDVSEAVHKLLKKVVHHIASNDALASEQEIYTTSYTKTMTYRNSVRTTLVSITRRQKADNEAQEGGRLDDTIGALGIRALLKAKELCEGVDKVDTTDATEILISLLRTSKLIGTTKEVDRKTKEQNELKKGKLDIQGMDETNLIASEAELVRADYPLPQVISGDDAETSTYDASTKGIIAAWGAGNTQHDLVGETRVCERCKTDFVVQPLDKEKGTHEACHYHWGKRRYLREGGGPRGPRLPRWTCCDALDEATTFASSSLSQIAVASGIVTSGEGRAFGDAGAARSSGCTRGPHVFKEEDAEALHAREAFVSSTDLCRQVARGGETGMRHEVLAFDCELVSTTAGLSLARLTVLDQAGKVVLDRHIRPRASILDYNTRFSGLREEDIPFERDGKHSLEGVREELGRMMTPSTVLVGHGLENDLKAIRLVHTRISDSVLLCPHPKGLPFRLSLRELSEKHLGRFIQQQGEVVGHDAEEDARAALDLVRLRFREVREQQSRAASAPAPQQVQPSASPQASRSTNQTPSLVPRPSPSPSTVARSPAISSPGPAAPSARATASLFIPKRKAR